MEHTFNFIIQSRKAFISLMEGMTLAELNSIPEGFNNNVIWNFGHIVVSTQGLCYLRTGVITDPSFVKYASAYAKGTKPTSSVTQSEVDDLKTLAIQSIEKLKDDYHSGLFKEITPFATDTYKETLGTIEEVITLTAGHDNLHYGYAIAQKRAIK